MKIVPCRSVVSTSTRPSIPTSLRTASYRLPWLGALMTGHSSWPKPALDIVIALPPTSEFFSSRRTFRPCFASRAAQEHPPKPPPTTMTSYAAATISAPPAVEHEYGERLIGAVLPLDVDGGADVERGVIGRPQLSDDSWPLLHLHEQHRVRHREGWMCLVPGHRVAVDGAPAAGRDPLEVEGVAFRTEGPYGVAHRLAAGAPLELQLVVVLRLPERGRV